MNSAFARRVGRAIRERELLAHGDRVAVAVSGGPDSVALLLALAELAPGAGWHLAGLVHVNHTLRAEASEADEQFCRGVADRLGLPIVVTQVDVRRSMREDHLSLEAAARGLRYAAFEAAAIELGATAVATGHTRDDQAETVLLRMLRGASLRGVSGIRARRGLFVRPLLDSRRADARAYLDRRGEPFREDRSNEDESIPRNRLRRVLMPVLEDLWPGGPSALARFADLAADDDAWLAAEVKRFRSAAVQTGPSGVELNRGVLRSLPRAIARRVVRDAIEVAGGHPSYRDVDAVMRLAGGSGSGRLLNLRGLTVERRADGLTLTQVAGSRPAGPVRATPAFVHALAVPGVTTIPETGIVISASHLKGTLRPEFLTSHGLRVAVQAGRVVFPLTVRSRRPGDRVRAVGAPGERKLQDLMVDRKIPCGDRDRVPIVVDAEGQIVWVAGVAVAERGRVTAPEDGVVILEIKKDGQ